MRPFIAALSLSLLAAPLVLPAQSQVVGPGGSVALGSGPGWTPVRQGGGFAEVTRDRPRAGFGGVGEGSLRLSVTGQQVGGEYPDWAFWYHYAGGSPGAGSFGSLQNLTSLSFDWWRSSLPQATAPCPVGIPQPIPPCDWAYKTPVVRLVLMETVNGVSTESELIWEGYFNQNQIGGLTPLDQWNTTTNMQNGNFWYIRHTSSGDLYSQTNGGSCNLGNFTFWQGNAAANGISQLLGAGGCLNGVDAQVVGVAVGVGSQWPLPYEGFVDNVRMGFNGQQVMDTNFDFMVPEPGTVMLLGLGMVGLGMMRRRRR